MIRSFARADIPRALGAHFTVGELWLDREIEPLILDIRLVEALDAFCGRFGRKPVFAGTRAIHCDSGHAANSYHYRGMAADFSIEGVPALDLAQAAERIHIGGIGLYREGTRHIHIDTGPDRRWWILTSGSRTPGFGGVPVTLRSGHRSPAVALLQKRLSEDGFNAGAPDGDFGPKTKAALTRWQERRGLRADGVFGAKTNAAMGLLKGW